MKSILIAAASVLVPMSLLVIHQVYNGNKFPAFSSILDETHKKLVGGGVTSAQGNNGNKLSGLSNILDQTTQKLVGGGVTSQQAGTSQKLQKLLNEEKLNEEKRKKEEEEKKKKEEEERDTTPPFTGFRLPTDIVPQHYHLRLRTDLEEGIFDGTVEIEVANVIATKVIRLHTKGLEIDVKKIRVNELEIKRVEVPKEDSDNDFLVIKLKEDLPIKKDHLVQIPFKGKLNADLKGYYLSNYTQVDAQNNVVNKLLAVTRFEPTYARETFPCFDEPHMKASFTITLGHKKEYKAVTNMPMDQTTRPDENGWVWDEFKTSAVISPSTVVFIVSELESLNFKSNEMFPTEPSISYEIWSRPEMGSQLPFARVNMPILEDKCQKFFGTKLPLDRMALVTAPNLNHRANENWGLITLSENSIMIDERQSSNEAKFQVLSVLAQGLAQQWFGNMATMDWWSDYWLIKGVASYASSFALGQMLYIDTLDFNGMTLLKVFSLDSFESSRPISAPIDNPRKINQISDDLTYYKGLLVIYMINSIVGPNEFKTGVGSFLKAFQFKAAGPEEFWKAVTTAANTKQILPPNVSIKDVVDSWTKQAGYPVLTVKRVGSKVTVSQKRFFKKKPTSEDNEEACWFVPVTFSNVRHYETTTKPTPSMWLSCENREITFESDMPDTEYILLNNKASGIYRVNYDEEILDKIIAIVKNFFSKSRIQPVNRMQLISDAMEMAYVGQLSYKKAFEVLRIVEYDNLLLLPWEAVVSSLEDLRNLLIRTDKYDRLKVMVQKTIQNLFTQRYYSLRYMNTNMQSAKLTSLAFTYACMYEVNACKENTNFFWTTSFKGLNKNGIHTDIRGTVYCEAVRQGGETEWNNALKYFQDSIIASEKGLFLEALACTKDKELLKTFLTKSLDESSGIPKQDSWRVFWITADYSKDGFEVALRFLQDNLQAIYDYNKPNTAVLAKYFEVLAKKLVFKDEIDQMKQFATDHKNLLEDSWTGITQAMEQMDINLQWHETHYENIEQSFL